MVPPPAVPAPLEPHYAATAARAHAVIDQAAQSLRKAEEDAVGRGMAVVASAAANAIETAVHCYNVTPVGAPIPEFGQILAAIPGTNVEHTKHWLARVIRAAIEAGRRAGYHEAQADFVLQMMLTEEGKDVLQRLAGITDDPASGSKIP